MRLTFLLLIAFSTLAAEARGPKRGLGSSERERATKETRVARPAARIVGLAEGGIYAELPAIQVALGELPKGAGVWVEAYRGPARRDGRGVNLPSQLVRFAHGWGLKVPGFDRCSAPGTWTIQVLMSAGTDTRILARRTFQSRPGDSQPSESQPSLILGGS